MKDDEYYVIHRSVLPDYFEKVIEIKEIISSGVNISDACKKVGLSRSTFYKYKDYVNRPSVKVGKRVLLSFKMEDEPGTLSNVLNEIASRHANVLAINQEVPIHNIAYVNITADIMKMEISVQEFIQELKSLKAIIDVTLLAVE
jgi:chorismate mutase